MGKSGGISSAFLGDGDFGGFWGIINWDEIGKMVILGIINCDFSHDLSIFKHQRCG